MTSINSRRTLPRILAGTVLAGTLAFAAQVAAQQAGTQAQGERPDRGAEQRGPGGRGGRGGPGQGVERRVSMLTERLGLSATQAVSVREILEDEQARMEALRPEGAPAMRGPGGGMRGPRPDSAGRAQRTRPDSATRGQRTRGDSASRASRPARPDSAAMAEIRTQMNVIRTQTDARIENVLTASQRTTYRQIVAARGERPEGGPGRGRGGKGGPGRAGGDRSGQQGPPPAGA